jgi:hypothetical protein
VERGRQAGVHSVSPEAGTPDLDLERLRRWRVQPQQLAGLGLPKRSPFPGRSTSACEPALVPGTAPCSGAHSVLFLRRDRARRTADRSRPCARHTAASPACCLCPSPSDFYRGREGQDRLISGRPRRFRMGESQSICEFIEDNSAIASPTRNVSAKHPPKSPERSTVGRS